MTEAEKRYRVVAHREYQIGSEAVLLTSSTWEGVRKVTPVEASVLKLCIGDRTLEQHARVVGRAFMADALDEIRQVLVEMTSVGFLRPSPAAKGPLGAGRAGLGGRISTLGIPTADRPEHLERCLDSYTEHAVAHQRGLEVIVVDGSQDAAHRAANERAIRRRGTQAGVGLRYIGPDQQVALRAALAARGADRKVVDFALTTGTPGFSAGASRNILLVVTAGRMGLHVDDDTLCVPWTEDARRPGVDLFGHGDPRRTAFCVTREEAIETGRPANVDLFEEHERMLGQSIQHVLDAAGSQYDVSNACPHLMAALAENRSEAVRMTLAGIAGDSGEYCPYNVLFRGGAAKEQLVSDPRKLALALSSREVSRVVQRQTVTHFNMCMMYCAGLDNRSALPPFPPTGRNEDGVFGALVGLCLPGGFLGHVPFGIVHDSEPRRGTERSTIVSASQLRTSEVLLAVLRRCPASSSSDTSERMRHVGTYLEDVARADVAEIEQLMTEAILDQRCRELKGAERSVGEGVGRAAWLNAVGKYRRAFVSNVTKPSFFIPIELAGGKSAAGGALGLKRLFGDYGRLLLEWPVLWETAKSLGEDHRTSEIAASC